MRGKTGFSSNFCETQLRYRVKKVELKMEKSDYGSCGIKNNVNGVADPD
jgi:hypothetical protein